MIYKPLYFGVLYVLFAFFFPAPLYVTLGFSLEPVTDLLVGAGAFIGYFGLWIDWLLGDGGFQLVKNIVSVAIMFEIGLFVVNWFRDHAANS